MLSGLASRARMGGTAQPQRPLTAPMRSATWSPVAGATGAVAALEPWATRLPCLPSRPVILPAGAPESSAPSQSRPGSSADPAELEPIQADASTQADRLQAGAAEQPAQEDTPRDSLGRGEGAHLDSTATELPEEWVTALHSMGSSEVASQPISAPSEDGAVPPDSWSRPASALRARPCESSASGFLDKDLEPLLPSDARCSVTASSFPGAGHHSPAGEEPCSQLRVRSRLFSTSEDAPLGTHPQMLASSPTNPFDTAEILGSDSIPSSPFGDSMADEWLHVHEGLLERCGTSYKYACVDKIPSDPRVIADSTCMMWLALNCLALCPCLQSESVQPAISFGVLVLQRERPSCLAS